MNASNDLYTRTFIFSQQQMDLKTEIEKKKNGKPPKFGTVIVNGTPKVFTDIILNIGDCKFSDAIPLVSGDIRRIKYKEGSR